MCPGHSHSSTDLTQTQPDSAVKSTMTSLRRHQSVRVRRNSALPLAATKSTAAAGLCEYPRR